MTEQVSEYLFYVAKKVMLSLAHINESADVSTLPCVDHVALLLLKETAG